MMVAPITQGTVASANETSCRPSAYLGCVDAHWGNHGLFATDTGNDDALTREPCARKCGELSFSVAGVGWGGAGHGSNCLCGNTEPPKDKLLHGDKECTAHTCSGNATETCGGNWRTQVFSIHCAPAPPAAAQAKTVWIPPGDWLPFNSSQVITGGPATAGGKLLTSLVYELHEIPLFVRAGSVIPTQPALTKADAASVTTVWIIFPTTASSGGSGSGARCKC
eukprot:SAG22_NODE_356_length_11774_cov_17.345353_9_plen_223_part_00